MAAREIRILNRSRVTGKREPLDLGVDEVFFLARDPGTDGFGIPGEKKLCAFYEALFPPFVSCGRMNILYL